MSPVFLQTFTMFNTVSTDKNNEAGKMREKGKAKEEMAKEKKKEKDYEKKDYEKKGLSVWIVAVDDFVVLRCSSHL